MKNLKQTIEACKIAKANSDKIELLDHEVRVVLPGEFIYTAALDITVSKPRVIVDLQGFMNISSILYNQFNIAEVGNAFLLKDDKGSEGYLKYLVDNDPQHSTFKGDYIGFISFEDLLFIKQLVKYGPERIQIANGYVCISSKYIQTTVRSRSELTTQIQIPFHVAKVLSVGSMGMLSVFSHNFTVTIENVYTKASISFVNPKEPLIDGLLSFSKDRVVIPRSEMLLSLNRVSSSRKFNNRVHLTKTPQNPDLQIDFSDREVRLTNILNRNSNILPYDNQINKRILTYGGILTRLLREFTDESIEITLNHDKGLTINNKYTIASHNG